MPLPADALFDNVKLSTWLQRPVAEDATIVVEGVVWGWLSPLLGVTTRPSAPSPFLLAAALELGAIAFANPEGLSRYSLDSESSEYSSERRDEILQGVPGGGTTPAGAALTPSGSFPSARVYPDPAERC